MKISVGRASYSMGDLHGIYKLQEIGVTGITHENYPILVHDKNTNEDWETSLDMFGPY